MSGLNHSHGSGGHGHSHGEAEGHDRVHHRSAVDDYLKRKTATMTCERIAVVGLGINVALTAAKLGAGLAGECVGE
jgi:hypothetical protein